MARPLRIVLPGAWYHVMNRGHRRSALFLSDPDRRRFLGRVAELPERFGVEIHAFVLMDNHYHLLLRTGERSLSDAIGWLQVSYSARFNWAHRLCGAVFAGRFKAVVVADEAAIVEVARYVHLNPVRVGGLGLGKEDQRRAKVVGCAEPGAELVRRRLKLLQEYPWSSWRVYAGEEPAPEWLSTRWVSRACGGRSYRERRAALRQYTEAPVREGRLESPWARLIGGLVLGEEGDARRLLAGQPMNVAEQTEARRLRRRVKWEDVVRAAEGVQGGAWREWAERYGDWGRDGALYVAVRYGGCGLAEAVRQMPGLRYGAAAQGVKRFAAALERSADRRRYVSELRQRLSIV